MRAGCSQNGNEPHGGHALGMGIARVLNEFGVRREVVTGHDFRGYSSSIKLALTAGLMAAGCQVRDIGLALTPMAYFAQFALDVPAVATVTASHNENGWTGVKMGAAAGDLRTGGDRAAPGHRARPATSAQGGRRL